MHLGVLAAANLQLISVLCIITSCIFQHYTNSLFICLRLLCAERSAQKRARFYEFVLTL